VGISTGELALGGGTEGEGVVGEMTSGSDRVGNGKTPVMSGMGRVESG